MAHSPSPLDQCAQYARGGSPPAPDHDSDIAARRKRIATEQGRLVEWAAENGYLKSERRRLPEYGRGGEHLVFFHKAKKRYFKETLPDKQLSYGIALGSQIRGATPSEYLDRLSLQNEIFSDDIQLEYVLSNNGKPIIVTSQPAVEGQKGKVAAICQMMVDKGYIRLTDDAFYDGRTGLLVFDLFPRNVLETASQLLLPIDPVIQRIDHDFAEFLRAHPYTINLHL
jgi:hypothetical protein